MEISRIHGNTTTETMFIIKIYIESFRKKKKERKSSPLL